MDWEVAWKSKLEKLLPMVIEISNNLGLFSRQDVSKSIHISPKFEVHILWEVVWVTKEETFKFSFLTYQNQIIDLSVFALVLLFVNK